MMGEMDPLTFSMYAPHHHSLCSHTCRYSCVHVGNFLLFYFCVYLSMCISLCVVSHKIVAHHEGTLCVHSEGVGHGTTMTVVLPAKRELVNCTDLALEMEEQKLTENTDDDQPKATGARVVSFREHGMMSFQEPVTDDLDLGTLLFAEDVKLNRKMMKKSLAGCFTKIVEVPF